MLLGVLLVLRMHPGWAAFLLAALCATAASLAYASGLVAWFTLPIAAAARPDYRQTRYVVAWLIFLALFFFFYVSDYAVPVSEAASLSLDIPLRYGFL